MKIEHGDRLAWRYACWVMFAAVVSMTVWPFDLSPEGPFAIGTSRVASYATLSFVFAMAYPRHLAFATSIPLLCLCANAILPVVFAQGDLNWPDIYRKAAGIAIGVSVSWATRRTRLT